MLTHLLPMSGSWHCIHWPRVLTIHNRGRKLDGPPPIEAWISWGDPQTPEPDFHVPSSLGWLEIVR